MTQHNTHIYKNQTFIKERVREREREREKARI